VAEIVNPRKIRRKMIIKNSIFLIIFFLILSGAAYFGIQAWNRYNIRPDQVFIQNSTEVLSSNLEPLRDIVLRIENESMQTKLAAPEIIG
jgi:hypothetical protein